MSVQESAVGQTMSSAEIENYEKSRDTSFLYGIPRRIREWCEHAHVRHDDDVVDIIGYLVWERIGTPMCDCMSPGEYARDGARAAVERRTEGWRASEQKRSVWRSASSV